jgi:hypothetical protein
MFMLSKSDGFMLNAIIITQLSLEQHGTSSIGFWISTFPRAVMLLRSVYSVLDCPTDY